MKFQTIVNLCIAIKFTQIYIHSKQFICSLSYFCKVYTGKSQQVYNK